jgi:hypothetical protein
VADQTSPHRRFQFRLRTLMICVTLLAVICGYLGGQWRIVKERSDLLDSHGAANLSLKRGLESSSVSSWVRQWFGDRQWSSIVLWSDVSDETLKHFVSAFPEARIWRMTEQEQKRLDTPVDLSNWPIRASPGTAGAKNATHSD